jgi:hypothetical protein
MLSSTKTKPVYTAVFTSVLAVVSAGLAGPAHAATAYDGNWSVVINTRDGSCTPSIRYGVSIVNGRVINSSNGAASVNGQVNPRGAVTVSVQSGGASAFGSGRLGQLTGTGVWRGQGSMGTCQGTWVAQRAGYGAGAGLYDYYNYGQRSYSYYNYRPQPYYNYGTQPYSYYGYGWQR